MSAGDIDGWRIFKVEIWFAPNHTKLSDVRNSEHLHDSAPCLNAGYLQKVTFFDVFVTLVDGDLLKLR